jgi:hypothetical protein
MQTQGITITDSLAVVSRHAYTGECAYGRRISSYTRRDPNMLSSLTGYCIVCDCAAIVLGNLGTATQIVSIGQGHKGSVARARMNTNDSPAMQ